MAKARRSDAVRLLGFARRSRAGLMMSTALQTASVLVLALPAQAQPAANARPTGGTVVAGSASISRASSDTRIDQSSQRAAIDWRSFDVGARQSVTFAQPSASAVALNRVTGPDPSQIAGRIDANGQIILVNQSGVTFYQGAQVNAAGVMVSAANITNQNFMAGSMTFDQASRNPNARIDNRGSITVREAGLAALVAPQVANSGVITARLGHVVLAGAKTATLDLYGDGLLSLDVGNQVMQVPVGPDGKAAPALVTNTGVIVADGGTVQLTARAADGLVQTLVQAGGTIQAASVGARTGVVTVAGVGGSVVVEGQLSAPGSAPGTMGGTVQVVADHGVTVAGTARIDASGQAGGGVVAIGTTLDRARGGPGATAAMTAANTTVQAGARVSANATGKGDGGRVVVLSKTATTVAAPIQAKGGPLGGNGGMVETSGATLAIASGVAIDAGPQTPTGALGTWLVDPLDLHVVNGTIDVGVATAAGPPFTVTPNATPSHISNTTIDGELNGGTNVVLTTLGTPVGGTGAITVDAGATIGWTTGASLTMNAAGGIVINAPISNTTNAAAVLALNAGAGVSQDVTNGAITVGNLAITAAGTVTLGAANAVTTLAALVTGSGNPFSFVNGATPLTVGTVGGVGGVATQQGPIGLTTTTSGDLTLAHNVAAGTATVTLTSAGAIKQTTSIVTAGTLTGSAISVDLGKANAVATLGNFAATAGDFTLNNAGSLTIAGTVTAGPVLATPNPANTSTLSITTTTGPLALGAAGTPALLNAGHVALSAGGAISQPNGTVIANTLTAATTGTGGDIRLTGTANNVARLIGVSATTGDVAMVFGLPTMLTGAYSGNNLFFEVAQAGGALQLGDNLTGATLTATAASNPRISLVADLITEGTAASTITAASGTVELAPFTPGRNVSLAGTADPSHLLIDGTLIGDISAGTVTVGRFTDAGGTLNPPSAGPIAIDGIVNLGTVAGTLRLDAEGPISQSAGGALKVGTLAVSTNTGTGDVTLNNPANAIDTLGDVAVGKGNFSLVDTVGTLTIPATVYAQNTTVLNNGSIVIGGNIGACEIAPAGGNLSITATDIVVNAPALIGAQGTATLAATIGDVIQNGGLINATNVTITAAGSFAQNAGTIAALGTTGIANSVSAAADFSQSAAGVITSNSGFSLTAANFTTAGTIVGVGSGTVTTTPSGTFTQNGGVIAAGGDLSLLNTSSIVQNAGTLSAGRTLTINSTGAMTQGAGAVVAGDTVATTLGDTPQLSYAGSVAVTLGGTIVDCVCTGVVAPGDPPGTPPGAPPLPAPQPPLVQPYHIIVTQSDYTIGRTLSANWVEIHTTGDTAETVGGSVHADLLTGTAANAIFDQKNQVLHLGTYAATGNFTLNDITTLAVIDTVSVGNGKTLSLESQAATAPALSIDHSGGTFTVPSVPGGVVHTDSFVLQGSLSAPGTIDAGGTVSPGQILLQSDSLALLAGGAPGGVIVSAPDGLVAIAPFTTGATITLGTGTGLVLSQATLNTINTLGSGGGTTGTETLMLGSLDGNTLIAGGINVNSGIVLPGSGANGIARNLVLAANGAIQETNSGSLHVVSLAGVSRTGAQGFKLLGANAIGEIGNSDTRIVSGTTFTTAGTFAPALKNLVSDGDVRLADTGVDALTFSGTLSVIGTVAANVPQLSTLVPSGTISFPSGTISLQMASGDALQIIQGSTALPTGTITAFGALIANPGTINNGTITPSAILLQTDSLRIASTGTTPIVNAPSGLVAIAPVTPGLPISIDAVATVGGPTLSLGTTDLGLISTLSGPLGTVTPGPAGTQTLALGSVDAGTTITAGAISISPGVTLDLRLGANTLALYSIGDVTEQPLGAGPTSLIKVNTLTGTVTAGSIYLNGDNQFTNLGNLATRGGTTTPGGVNADLLATSGNILIRNTQDLNVVANVAASSAPGSFAEIDVLKGAAAATGDLTVLQTGTVQSWGAFLRAGDAATAGNVNVAGDVLASVAADVAAGIGYTPATPTTAPSIVYGLPGASGTIDIPGLISVPLGTAQLVAAGSITEGGTIQAGLLTGFAASASLPGGGAPTSNRIDNLGSFQTQNGFLLRDGSPLSVVGPVTDMNQGITIAVAPPGVGTSTYGAGDLVLAGTIQEASATGIVKLEATGNVREVVSGITIGVSTDFVSTHTLTATDGIVIATTLVSQAGAIPDTESTGNEPGTVPGTTIAPASVTLGNTNQIGTIGVATLPGITATDSVLVVDGEDLTVAGTVIAVSGTASIAAHAGFGTPGDLTNKTLIKAGGDALLSADRNVNNGGTVLAGHDANLGAGVDINNRGTVSADHDAILNAGNNINNASGVSAGHDANLDAIVDINNSGAVSTGHDANLNAGNNINNAGGVSAGNDANLGAGVDINNLGTVSAGHDANLNAGNNVNNGGGVSAGNDADLGAGVDINNNGTISAGHDANLNAGNDINNAGGVSAGNDANLGAGVDINNRGAVSAGHDANLNAGNDINNAGGVSAGNDANLGAGVDINNNGTISAGHDANLNAGNDINNAGAVSAGNDANLGAGVDINNNGTISAGHDANLNAGNDINNAGGVSAGNDANLGAGVDINNNGTISAGHDANLNAGNNVNNGGGVSAGNDANLGAGVAINDSGTISAGHDANLNAGHDINNGGTVSGGHDAKLSAGHDINNAGGVSAGHDANFGAGNDINTSGSIAAANHGALIAGTAGSGSISETAGTIMARGNGSVAAPSLSLVAHGGTIGQAASATLAATDPGGVVALDAGQSIALGGTLFAGTAAYPSGATTASGTVVLLARNGDISETAPGGSTPTGLVGTNLLTASATGSVLLNTVAAPGNRVTSLGTSSAGSGNFVLNDAASLTVTGDVTAGGTLAITDSASIAQNAGTTIRAAGAGTATSPSLSLIAAGGSISQAGGASIMATDAASGTVGLTAATDVVVNGLVTAAGASTASLASVSINAQSGAITQLATGTVSATNVTAGTVGLTAATNVTVDGLVTAAGASATNAPSVSLVARNGTLSQGSDGTIAATNGASGTIGLTAATGAEIDGLVTAAGVGTASLPSVSISVPGGTLNQGGTGTVAATNAGAGTVALSGAGGVMLHGTVADGSSVTLVTSGGSIAQDGTLIADLLTGSAAGDAALTGAGAPSSNRVVQLGSFSSGGTFTLNDAADLTITGPLTAPTIKIDTGSSRITLADRAVITTGGIQRPFGIVTTFPPDPPLNATPGAYLTTGGGFTQQGASSVQGIGGGPNILRINALGNANIAFDPFAGLQGPNTWLILQIDTGRATGQIHVRNLDVISKGGLAGASDLTGSVTGLTGAAAAGAAGIVPNPNSNFRFNQCAIQSVSCILLPGESVPTANPLNDINIGTLFNPNEDEDLLLPIVSDQDY